MTSQNSLNNQTYDADFIAFRQPASAGTTCFIQANHLDTTNPGSSAQVVAQSTAASGADAYHVSALASTRAWCHGIDASDSGALKETTFAGGSTSPSTGTLTRKVTTAGEQTMPLQPAFFARLTVTTGGVTGNGAIYTLGNNGGGTMTVDYDQGSDVSFPGGNFRFIAPVTGVYRLGWQLTSGPYVATQTSAGCSLLVNATPYNGMTCNPFNTVSSAGAVNTSQDIQLLLTAGDAVTFAFQVTGGPLDTVTITSTANATYVYGALIC